MPKWSLFRTAMLAGLAAVICSVMASSRVYAADKKVLWVTITGSYNADGVNMYNELAAVAGTDQATYVVLSGAGGQVVEALAADTYEQIWVYDLSTNADSYAADYEAIADWFEAGERKEAILDGRYLSSFWNNRFSTEGRKVTQNYFYNLDVRGGGLMLATDHNIFANAGMNALCAALGFGNFTGNFGGEFPLDAGHPLSTVPNEITSLWNDSSTSQSPYGVQANGRVLLTVGYHSGNETTPGISTTIDGGSLGIAVEIEGEDTIPCDGPIELSAVITQGEDRAPFTFEWFLDDEPIGDGADITVDMVALGPGSYTFRVLATGEGGRADDDLVTLVVNGCGCIGDGPDGDDDGTPDCIDGCPDDPNKADPLGCGCGVPEGGACATTAMCEAAEGFGPFGTLVNEGCVAQRPVGELDPVVAWAKSTFEANSTFVQVMMTPVVMNLTDDNGDGVIDDRDIADIAFTRFAGSAYGSAGVVTVLSGDDGSEIWSSTGEGNATVAGAGGVALGDLDGNGRPELCVTLVTGGAWRAGKLPSPAAPGQGLCTNGTRAHVRTPRASTDIRPSRTSTASEMRRSSTRVSVCCARTAR